MADKNQKNCVKICSHCGVEFNTHSYTHYFCSPICRQAAYQKKHEKQLGPCPTCHNMFTSKTPGKIYCSLKCYTTSDQFKKMSRENGKKQTPAALARRNSITCLECGVQFFAKPWQKNRKFCSVNHHRLYLSKRFDRWIASPQGLGLPQNYDEFMTQETLPCLIDGCNWAGKHLGNHVNLAHGVLANDFKRAAGFNLGTGLITSEVRNILSERSHIHETRMGDFVDPVKKQIAIKAKRNYRSLEGAEHKKKAILLLSEAVDTPKRICFSCGKEFSQSSVYGRTKHCSIKCRTKFYASQKETIRSNCSRCGKEFLGRGKQIPKIRAGLPVFCGAYCGQRNKIKRAKVAT